MLPAAPCLLTSMRNAPLWSLFNGVATHSFLRGLPFVARSLLSTRLLKQMWAQSPEACVAQAVTNILYMGYDFRVHTLTHTVGPNTANQHGEGPERGTEGYAAQHMTQWRRRDKGVVGVLLGPEIMKHTDWRQVQSNTADHSQNLKP